MQIEIEKAMINEAIEAMADAGAYHEANVIALAPLAALDSEARQLAQEQMQKVDRSRRLLRFFAEL